MISEEFRLKFKKELGETYRYTSKVQVRLNVLECFNQKGKPFSKRSIVEIFNGRQENEDVELAIHQVFDKAVSRIKELNALKNKHKMPETAPKSA